MLPRAHVRVPLDAGTLREALAALIRQLHALGEIRDVDGVERVVARSGLRDIVTVEDRVALPHYRTDAVDRLLVAMGVAPLPLDTSDEGLAASPRIVVLVLAPFDSATAYLRTVASLARALRHDGVVDSILAARSPDDILAIGPIGGLEFQPRLTVRDIMRHEPEFVSPDAPARDAVELLARRTVRAVPVVGDKHEVLGMLSERDVMRALIPQLPRGADSGPDPATRPSGLTVRDIMTRSVLCVSEDMSLDEAASMMVNKDFDQVPVVSQGKLVGVITRGDIIRKLFAR